MSVQEQATDKVIGIIINAGKSTMRTSGRLTSKMLANAMKAVVGTTKAVNGSYKKSRDERLQTRAQGLGEVPLKRLLKQNDNLKSMDIMDKSLKSFERIARKYGVSYSVQRNVPRPIESGQPDKPDKPQANMQYTVLFKAKQEDAIIAAFQEFSEKTLRKEQKKSILNPLREKTEALKGAPAQTKTLKRGDLAL